MDTMNINEGKHCIQMLSKLGVKSIIVIGGEPTVYGHLIELIKYAHSNGLKVSMVSNGRRFSDYSFAKSCVESGISGIDISLKAISKNEYIVNTGMNGFDESILGYKNLLSLGFNPTISYVICDDNTNRLAMLVNLLDEYEMDNITFQFVKPVVSEKAEIMSMDKMGKIVSVLYKLMENSKKHYRIEASIPLCLIEETVRNELMSQKKLLTCCHVQRGSGLVFDTKLRLLLCNHFVDMPYSDTRIGVESEDKMIKFWNSDFMNNIRKKTQCYPSAKCEQCKLWDQCGGGCFTRWLSERPDSYICGVT